MCPDTSRFSSRLTDLLKTGKWNRNQPRYEAESNNNPHNFKVATKWCAKGEWGTPIFS